jgi:hypothetical protein
MRKTRLAVLLMVIAPSMAYKIAKAEQSQIPDVYAAQSAEPDHRGTTQQPLVISKLPEERNRERIVGAAHARNELIVMLATVLLTFFTGALWLVNIWLIKDARRVSDRQALDTRRAIDEQTRAANAMHEVAEATRNNAILMSAMFAKQMRAYISVEVGTAIFQDKNLRFEAIPTLTNNGLTPARILADILDGSQSGLEFTEIGDLLVNDMGMAPRQALTIRRVVANRVPDAEVAGIMAGISRRLFAWGKVTYDDVYGGSWETNFCLSYWFVKIGDDWKVFGNFFPKHYSAT